MNKSLARQLRPARRTHQQLPLRLLTLAAVACLTSGAAQAQDSYWLFGLGAGQTRGVFNDVALTNQHITPNPALPISSYSIATDRRDAGYKVFFGRQFNPYVGIEGGYFNLGKYGFQTTTTPAGTLTGEIRAQGVNADVVGTLPLTNNFSVIGRVGAAYTRTRAEYGGSGAVTVRDPNPSERKATMKIGLGVQYAISNSFHVRAEAEQYRVDDAQGERGKVRMYSVSLVFPFGRSAAPMARTAYRAPAPAPMREPVVVMAPPAPPVVVVVQAPPPPAPAPLPPAVRRVSYSAESLFGFDKSTVRPEGMAALDSFAAELAGAQFDSVTVEGHTDRLGSTAYNQSLSEQRAEAVKNYLVTQGKVDPAKIKAVGMSESTPVTKPEDCKGTAQSATLIACLQPDRRVEIEVSGTR
jgi:OOP family OmpA-OmpF porin